MGRRRRTAAGRMRQARSKVCCGTAVYTRPIRYRYGLFAARYKNGFIQRLPFSFPPFVGLANFGRRMHSSACVESFCFIVRAYAQTRAELVWRIAPSSQPEPTSVCYTDLPAPQLPHEPMAFIPALRNTPPSILLYPPASSHLCLVGENPTCSVPALQGCEGLWPYDYGMISSTPLPPAFPP